MEQPIIRGLLLSDYGIDDHWIHKETGKSEYFYNKIIIKYVNKKIKSSIYYSQKEFLRKILKPLKKTREINPLKLGRRANEILTIYKSSLFKKDFFCKKRKRFTVCIFRMTLLAEQQMSCYFLVLICL